MYNSINIFQISYIITLFQTFNKKIMSELSIIYLFIFFPYCFFLLIYSSLSRNTFRKLIALQPLSALILLLAQFDRSFYIALIIYFVALFVKLLQLYFHKLKKGNELKKYTVVPTSKINNKIKFYEIGSLIDGKMTNADLNAYYIFHKLNPFTEEYNTVDNKLLEYIESTGGISRLINTLAYETLTIEKSTNQASFSFSHIDRSVDAFQLVSEQLVADGFFRFSPEKKNYRRYRILLWLFTLGVLFALITVEYNLLLAFIASLIVWVYVSFCFSHSFQEDIQKVAPVRAEILGHKMFLQTADFYRIEHDEQVYRDLLPYFVAYGFHKDKIPEALKKFGLLN